MNRTSDRDRINALAGVEFHEAVIAEPMHVFLEEGENIGCFVWRGPGNYEIHLGFAVRGRDAIALLDRMLAVMRAEHGAHQFWAAIPLESRNVRMFARLAGFVSEGTLPFMDGPKEIFVSEKCGCHP